MDYQKTIERHIRARIEELTSPNSFAYGYNTYVGAEAQLTELAILADRLELYDLAEKVRSARRPITEKIEDFRRSGRSFGIF